MIKPSTVEQGDRFRDAVAAILRTKYNDVEVERRVGHKKVDIVFSRHEFGRRMAYGVECKDYGRPLTKEQITEIYADYAPLVEAKNLDRVIIVASRPVSADARTYVESVRWLSLQTDRQLEEELLGLREYIEALAGLFKGERLEAYYVEARLVDSPESAADYVEAWLQDNSPLAPLAIMGGYGKGKTSFALRLVSAQAKRYLADATERMPVFIRLGQVVHETQLEGLFGKEFTARQPATDFRFRTLEHLNELGRLLIVLDGFDEMKHAMSAGDFRSNFREFNRLIKPNAKVVILGRPNAIPTEARDHVFRGTRAFGTDAEAIDPNFQPWNEVEIDFFSGEEVSDFLQSYMTHLTTSRARELPEGFIERRLQEIQLEVSYDLLKRPVHAKIVGELASDPRFDLRGFTQHTLYAQFIQRLIERDVDEKQARKDIGVKHRLRFQRELAWWCWTKQGDGQGFFDRDQVPRSLLEGLPDGRSTDAETKLAEYLVSTLTEEKEAGILYFAHRSFQEFLVAERIREWTPSADQHVQLAAALTVDIHDFLDSAPDRRYLWQWYETLGACAGPLPTAYLRLFQADLELASDILNKPAERMTAADAAIIALRPIDPATPWISERDIISTLVSVLTDGSEDAAVLAIAGLVRLRYESGSNDAARALALGLIVRVVQRMKEAEGLERGLFVPASRFGAPERICTAVLSKHVDAKAGRIVSVDVREALRLASKHLTVDSAYITRQAVDGEAGRVGQEFTDDPGDPTFSDPVAIPSNHLVGPIKEKSLQETVRRVLRLPGARFEVIEHKERGKTFDHSLKNRFSF